jgi:hypothetical protein
MCGCRLLSMLSMLPVLSFIRFSNSILRQGRLWRNQR